MIRPDRLREICAKYSGERYFAGKEIPASKLAGARAALKVPPGDEIFALVDYTFFGSARNGIVIASDGVYEKDSGEPCQHLSWRELRSQTFKSEGIFLPSVVLSNGKKLACSLVDRHVVESALIPLLDDLVAELNPKPAILRQICEKYSGSRYYSGQGIPASIQATVRDELKIPSDDEVFAVVDCTFFGSAGDGIAVASSGIYSKDMTLPLQHLTWAELESNAFAVEGTLSPSVVFSNGKKLTCSLLKTELIQNLVISLLKDLAAELKKPLKVEASGEWYVVIGPESKGPYEKEEVLKLLEEQAIAGSTLVWRNGSQDWMRLDRVPELTPQRDKESAPSQSSGKETERKAEDLLAKVNINNASIDELLLLPAMTLPAAERLIEERKARLGFTSIEEIGELLELPPHRVEDLRRYLVFDIYALPGHVSGAGKRIIDY